MTTFTNTTTTTATLLQLSHHPRRTLRASSQPVEPSATCRRRTSLTALLAASLATLVGTPPLVASAESWGTRSFIRERFFEPGLSPEDAVARIRQTAEGLHSIRDMLENMAWRYVLFYIRLKTAYLSQDLKNAITTLPEARRKDYVKAANELVDNMTEVNMS